MNNFDPNAKPQPPKDPFYVDPEKYGHKEAFWQTVIPSALYGIIGLIIIVTIIWLAYNLGYPIPFKWAALMVFVSFWPGFFIKAIPTWKKTLPQWMAIVEKVTGRDINGDGYVGEPPAPAEPQIVTIHLHNGTETDYIDLPVPPDKLKKFAVGVVQQKKAITTDMWVGDGFTRPEFVKLRAAMIERGLAAWKNEDSPNQGVDLTRQGLAALQYLASDNWRAPSPMN